MTAKQSSQPLILLAHGSSDERWQAPFLRLKELLRGQRDPERTHLAFMELCEPSLEAVLDELRDQGEPRARVLPLFFAAGRHLRQDVPEQIQAYQSRHPAMAIELLKPVGEDEGVLQALAEAIPQLCERAEVG